MEETQRVSRRAGKMVEQIEKEGGRNGEKSKRS